MHQASIMMTFLVMAMGAAWLALYDGSVDVQATEIIADFAVEAATDAALGAIGS